MTGVVVNRSWAPEPARADAPAAAFHAALPGFAPTPLIDAPQLAAELGLAGLLLKDESRRLGLGAFKVLGASWAAHVALCEHAGRDPRATSLAELRDALAGGGGGPALVTASAGNHGRAVAWFARQAGLPARVLLPAGTVKGRIDAIAGEGAEVVLVDGDYETAVARAAKEDGLLVADTATDAEQPGLVAHVVDGYMTLMAEVAGAGASAIVTPVGVGSLATAVVRSAGDGPRVLSVEPDDADCLAASVRAGEYAVLEHAGTTAMAGMNCRELSAPAWPPLRTGVAACLTVGDAEAAEGQRRLAEAGVDAGPCGGAVLGALLDESARAQAGLTAGDRVLLLVTEGPF